MIKGINYGIKQNFIATQAPIPGTFNDFFKMLMEMKCSVLVQLVPNKKDFYVKYKKDIPINKKKIRGKIYKYWPSTLGDEIEIEGYVIKLINYDNNKDLGVIMRHLNIMNLVNQKSKDILNLQFYEWEDNSIPNNYDSIKNMMLKIDKTLEKNPGIICVHCLAGIGRTGTFIAIFIMYYKMKVFFETATKNKLFYFDIYNIVLSLKKSRPGMVANTKQYVFLHKQIKYIAEKVFGMHF